MIPHDLRCAYLVDPLAVAPERVRLSWVPGSPQRAYHLELYRNEPWLDSPGTLFWDSGQVESGDCVDVAVDGPALVRGRRYTWRVRVRDAAGDLSEWSDWAAFEVELDPAGGWHASWIGLDRARDRVTPPTGAGPVDPLAKALDPAPYLRRAFSVDRPMASARLYVTALGLYEARLNGQRVGDGFLTPGWTDYTRRVLYQAYDVTGLLVLGENVLGAILADGWYAGFVGFDAKRAGAHYGTAPELLAQLVITFADGAEQRVGTDERWQATVGAIRHADLMMGSREEPSLEPRGWDAPGFAAGAGWLPVRCRDLDAVPVLADPGPPIRVTEEIGPAAISRDAHGRQIVDFGQNLPGWVRLRADGPAGTVVRVRHAEVLDADGSLYTENLRTARQTDEYVLPGGPAVLEPRFTQHGFRYAEITSDVSDMVARVVHSDIGVAGTFESAEPWLDRLSEIIDWGQRGNFISIPTDCPQRDERLGWLGDAQIFARTACYNRDVAAFFGKWLDDVADAQLPSGAFTDIAPLLGARGPGAPAWGDAGVIIPWTMWKMYGDRTVLRRHFGAMTAFMDFIEQANPDYLRTRELGNSYNDWLTPGPDQTPPELLATAYWAHDAALMAEIALAAGRADDAAGYRALRAKIGSAFSDAFVTADGRVVSGTQTAYVLALHMGLIPFDLCAAAASHLVAAIEAAGWRLTTGFTGVGYLLPVLSSCGYSDVAWRLLEQRSLPSWRYMADHGATTIWERWDGWTAENGFQSPAMNSFNHYSLGSVGEWLYRFLLGIDQAPGTAGFGDLLLRPHPGPSVRWARGAYRSVRGTVRAGWEVNGEQLTYRVEVPPNATASVRVPSAAPGRVRDGSGRPPVSVAAYLGALGAEEAVFDAGPGIHEFTGPALDVRSRF